MLPANGTNHPQRSTHLLHRWCFPLQVQDKPASTIRHSHDDHYFKFTGRIACLLPCLILLDRALKHIWRYQIPEKLLQNNEEQE